MSDLLSATQTFADEVAARPNHGDVSAPLADLNHLAELGLLTAALPTAHGGLGLGTEKGCHHSLLRLLAFVGGGDLVLGRIYEGHVNALILIATYGTASQLAQAAKDAHDGLLFGVWNTGGHDLLRLEGGPDTFTFHGVKTFATGAAFVNRPIVTAQLDDTGWQMTLPRMESPCIAPIIHLDHGLWHPLGMEASESYGIDFTGSRIEAKDLIGAMGDFYRDPLFRGGAIRFAAVQAGAVLRLHRLFAEWLEERDRGGDPYQIARLGEITISAQETVLWIERAGAVAEENLVRAADKLACERMVDCANMMRLAIERIATATIQRVIHGIGAHGLLQPSRFERIIRDLTMYLRQPAPDQTLADVGRSSLRKTTLRVGGAGDGLWLQEQSSGSLSPEYFRKIYKQSPDPWNFETSTYEADKYLETLSSLPCDRYASALEVGCSIGVLTQKLAQRCDALLSLDVSEQALAAARERCRDLPQVHFARMQVPREMPDGGFDLIVISEVAYYWQPEELAKAAELLAAHQLAGATLILVHFTVPVPDYPLTGDEVHDIWLSRPEWRVVKGSRHNTYRIDVLERLG